MTKALVIDDEQMARDTVELFIQKHTPELELIGKAGSIDQGVQLIKLHRPEIIFLDINMPEKNGFALFDEIDLSSIKIIFTTAYSEYAIKAINLSASYYLLKPISPIEFKKAVSQTIAKIEQHISDSANIKLLRDFISNATVFPKKIIINAKNGYELIETNQIQFLEGDKNYTWIKTPDAKHLVAKTLKEYEDILDPSLFFRCHQSHIINRLFVKKILNSKPDQIELTNGQLISLSRDKKKQFLDWLTK